MMIARRSFLGIVGLALTGCTVGPDYLKPDVTTPAAFRYQVSAGKAYANESWWQLFSDPVLRKLVNQSLAQNWDITIATARVEEAAGILVTRGVPFASIKLPNVPSDIPSDMLRQRPDIAQAEQELIAANARIGAAMAQYYPQLSLTGSLGVASGALSNLLTGPAGVWAIAGSVVGPIFDAGAIKGQVQATEAQKMAALANYVKTIHTAFQDVSDGLIGYEKSLESLAARNRAVKALQTTVHLSFLKFEEGQESYTTVLTAENDLYSAELEAINTRFSAFSSLVDVYKALGGGWTLDVGPDPALAASPQQARQSLQQATGG